MNRSTIMMLFGAWLGATAAHAQTQTAPATAPESAATTTPSTQSTAPAAPAGPQVQAEVVAVDAAGKTITVRESTDGDATDAAGKTPASATLPVEGNAVTRLGFVKAGSRVTLICAAPAAPDASAAKTKAATTESTSTATTSTDTTTAPSSSAPAAASGSTSETVSSDTSSTSPLNAACSSVIEIAKARATQTAPSK